jgi:phage gp45-like
MILTYWKQIGTIIAVLALAGLIYYRGYSAGESHIQAKWDAQKVLDSQAVAAADNKTLTITTNSEKATQNDNANFQRNTVLAHSFFNNHPIPTSNSLHTTTGKANSSEVPTIPDTTKQPDANATDTVSRADYEALANDCLATTMQLDNAQEWAKEQAAINAE